jgi:hypothetical protein
MEWMDGRILDGPNSLSGRDDEKMFSFVWNQTTSSTVPTIQTILAVVGLNKT